ncbi:extracellular solute-binding protein [Paenibacillus psychroresistens]|uniref:Extracellular solute-binding protein n=1 Tax=Paenibacillus psychroresistens TaxID=1778678 RepID=A0A6B8RUF0_9BACL|nr:extracellular solute-binding protein [Paenibacillus psychroresistens]QGQ98916.1 extracellular solute-binding protein [Paenibacillus psychroresistens]
MKYIGQLILIIIVMLLLGSCKEEQATKASNEDITELKFWGEGSTEWFITEIETPLKTKYPNIKFKILKQPTLKQAIEENNIPDIMLESVYWQSPESAQLGIQLDLAGLVKSNNLDMGKFQPEFIEKGPTFQLPFTRTHYVLNYNKDVFDLFQLPYPTDGMTWDEVLKLATQFKAEQQGKAFYGLYLTYNDIPKIATQLSLSLLDPTSNEPTLGDKKWDKLIDIWTAADTPKMESENKFYTYNLFSEGKNVAMAIGEPYGNSEQNVGVASLPVFADKARGGADSMATALSISTLSKHSKEAFQVIQYLVSEEFQLKMAAKGQFAALDQSIVEQSYGNDFTKISPSLKASIYYNDPVVISKLSIYDHFSSLQPFAGGFLDNIDTSIMYWQSFEDLKDGVNKTIFRSKLAGNLKQWVNDQSEILAEYSNKTKNLQK